jgi:acetyl esterase/lipase
MGNVVYYHKASPSIESKLIQFLMGLFGMKKRIEKKIVSNRYAKKPAELPKSILNRCKAQVEEHKGRKVWTLSPVNGETGAIILFLHGGAYYANITGLHWRFVEQIIIRTRAKIIVPDYPLAPESSCEETFQFIDAVYSKLISKYPSKKIILMGDSAGGGLALGFALKIKNEGIKQPEQVFLFSPWLDASMGNPDIASIEKRDKILSVNGLRIAARNYAGELDATDYRVSPIHGDFLNLGKISIFIGTNEVFIADARKCKKLLEEKSINFNYYEYPGMFHDWVIVSNLKESKDVISKIAKYEVFKRPVPDKVKN